MNEEVRYISIYEPKRDRAKLIINSIVYTVLFYIIVSVIGRCNADMASWNDYIKGIYWILFVIFFAGAVIAIFCRTKQCLQITDTEINYQCGVLEKRKVILPISKVRSCKIRVTILQRIYGSSTLSICTAGDADEICFVDIKDGEEACRIIKDLIK